MEKNDLRPWQARRVRERLALSLNYLSRLKERMERLGFTPNDSLFRAVIDAQQTMSDLCMDLHYLSCEGGVGMPDRNGDRPGIES
jgi:hypothetical protein